MKPVVVEKSSESVTPVPEAHGIASQAAALPSCGDQKQPDLLDISLNPSNKAPTTTEKRQLGISQLHPDPWHVTSPTATSVE